jgi:hypothetical protein
MMLLAKEKEKMGGVVPDGAMCAEQAQLQELKLQQYCETRNYGRSSSHN